MEAPETALRAQDTTIVGCLYIALECRATRVGVRGSVTTLTIPAATRTRLETRPRCSRSSPGRVQATVRSNRSNRCQFSRLKYPEEVGPVKGEPVTTASGKS